MCSRREKKNAGAWRFESHWLGLVPFAVGRHSANSECLHSGITGVAEMGGIRGRRKQRRRIRRTMLAVLIRRSEWGLWKDSDIPITLWTGIIGIWRIAGSRSRALGLRYSGMHLERSSGVRRIQGCGSRFLFLGLCGRCSGRVGLPQKRLENVPMREPIQMARPIHASIPPFRYA
jgi:hypothetical protein